MEVCDLNDYSLVQFYLFWLKHVAIMQLYLKKAKKKNIWMFQAENV